MKRPRLVMPWLIWALFAGSGGFVAATPNRTDISTSPSAELRPCHIPQHRQEAQCGIYTVFENRLAAEGRQIEIHFAVIPAISETSEPDPLVFFAGGPGQAAMEMAGFVSSVFSRLNEHRDVVLIDQRGMGSSHPLECKTPDEYLTAGPEEEARLTREVLRECLSQLDADVTLYTQDLANEDAHEVLLALGYQQVNLYGVSWGTRSALLYAHRFPEHVRTLILDGNLPLQNSAPLYAAEDAERALTELFVDCAADAACSSAFPTLRQDFEEVVRRLGTHGETITINDPSTGEAVTIKLTKNIFGEALRTVLYSSELSRLAPVIIRQTADGDYRALMGVYSYLSGALAETMTAGASLTIFCSEEMARMQDSDLQREMVPRLLGHQAMDSLKSACSVWPKAPLPAIYGEKVSSMAPALLLSGHADPITPPRWGEMLKDALPNSIHLVAPATGHNVAPQGCASQLMEQMIDQGSWEGIDGSCLEEITRPSFFINSSGPRGPASNTVETPAHTDPEVSRQND
ncbi:MAG: alpha/beta hydrolase [bacterium]|nr:alpha/beta hydrolase [bacterium]